MEVSIHGGTPSYHPSYRGIFPHKPTSYWGTPMTMETPILGPQHFKMDFSETVSDFQQLTAEAGTLGR